MNNTLTVKEREHIGKVKMLPCSLCDSPAPSSAHHVKQGNQYTCVALCWDCHQSPTLGWHGQKRMWAIKKMDMNDALNVTIKRLMEWQNTST
jgi:hypothetical protein